MKKLFYIILVVIVLALVGKFVKEKQAEAPVVESVTVTEEENVVSPDTVIVPDQDVQAVDEIDETVVVEPNQLDSGDGMVVDGTATQSTDEVVEENPEFTSGDDETIVAE